jgi:hypothetical protein
MLFPYIFSQWSMVDSAWKYGVKDSRFLLNFWSAVAHR